MGKALDRHGAGQYHQAILGVLNLLQWPLFRLEGNVSEERLKNVAPRHQPRHAAVLVENQHLAQLALLQGIVEIDGGLGLRDKTGMMENGTQIVGGIDVVKIGHQQIAIVENADNVIAVISIDGHTADTARLKSRQDLRHGGRGRQHHHAGARGHQRIYGGVTELENLSNQVGLGFVQLAVAHRFVGQSTDHLLGQHPPILTLATNDQVDEKFGDVAHQPTDRGDEVGKNIEGPTHHRHEQLVAA